MTTPRPQAETRPKEVEISFWLWISTIVLGLLGSVPILFQFDQLRAQAINQALADDPALDRSTIESVTTGALVAGAVIGLLLVVAQVIFVFLMRGGRNWARIVLAVLGGLVVLFGLIGFAGTTGAMGAGSLLQLLLLIGAIVTMFLPAANAWFRPRPAQL
ncbi:MAG: hypothetical protein M3257_00350 [Actinomycetota bacterium]|jgi:hypothetical protein|nr:hypothetical protein [Actinomycetota bacterium]